MKRNGFMRPRKAGPGGDAGFTLVELLIAMAVSSVVLLAVFSLFLFQQKSFSEQSELARNQSSLRSSLQTVTRDIRMAGYSGVALGMDRHNNETDPLLQNQFYPLRAVPGAALADGTTLLVDAQFGQSEGIEVQGNFTREEARVMGTHVGGVIDVTVSNPQAIIGHYVKRVMIGNEFSVGYYELTKVVDNGATAVLSLFPPLVENADDGDVVAPIQRRIYFLKRVDKTYGALTEPVGVLVQRRYVVNPAEPDLLVRYSSATCFVDLELAERMDYMDLRYQLYVPLTKRLDDSPDDALADTNDPPNPCLVRQVNLQLVSRTPVIVNPQGKEGTPMVLNNTQDIRPRNLGLLDPIQYANCDVNNLTLTPYGESPCNLGGTTIGL